MRKPAFVALLPLMVLLLLANTRGGSEIVVNPHNFPCIRIAPFCVEAVAKFENEDPLAAYRAVVDWVTKNGIEYDKLPAYEFSGKVQDAFWKNKYRLCLRLSELKAIPEIKVKVEGFAVQEFESALICTSNYIVTPESFNKKLSLLRDYSTKSGYKPVNAFRMKVIQGLGKYELRVECELQQFVSRKEVADYALYSSEGAEYRSVTAASASLWRSGASITTILSNEINEGKLAKKANGLYMPGGWTGKYSELINDKGVAHIGNFIQSGGSYFGVCAGAYYAAEMMVWEGKEIAGKLSLFGGKAVGSIAKIAPWPKFGLAEITLLPEFFSKRAPKRKVFYFGGPYFEFDEKKGDVEVIARYSINDKPAVILFSRGKGKVFLCGPHPEYDLTSRHDGLRWPENTGIQDDECDWDIIKYALSRLKTSK